MANKKVIVIAVVVISVLLVAGILLPTQEWAGVVGQWLISLGPWRLPTFVAVYVVASVLGLPNVVFLLAAGSVFGFLYGWLSASVADTAAAIACFLLGRFLIREQIKLRVERNSQFDQLAQAVTQKGWKIVLLSRLAPMIPSNVLNYGFSLTEVAFWPYLLCTWLGMLPVVGFYVYVGDMGSRWVGGNQDLRLLALQGAGLVIGLVVAVYLTRWAKHFLSSNAS